MKKKRRKREKKLLLLDKSVLRLLTPEQRKQVRFQTYNPLSANSLY